MITLLDFWTKYGYNIPPDREYAFNYDLPSDGYLTIASRGDGMGIVLLKDSEICGSLSLYNLQQLLTIPVDIQSFTGMEGHFQNIK